MAVEQRHTVGRNDPCPCGSGKKYKVCHLREDEARVARGEPVIGEEYVPPSKVVPAVIAGVGLAVALGAGFLYGVEAGGLFGVIGALVLGGYFLFRKLPPPNSSGNASGLNFGR